MAKRVGKKSERWQKNMCKKSEGRQKKCYQKKVKDGKKVSKQSERWQKNRCKKSEGRKKRYYRKKKKKITQSRVKDSKNKANRT